MIKTTRLNIKSREIFIETLEIIKSVNKRFRNLLRMDYPSSKKVYLLK